MKDLGILLFDDGIEFRIPEQPPPVLTPVKDSCQMYLTFDNVSLLTDLSGHGRNGVLYGDIANKAGKISNAVFSPSAWNRAANRIDIDGDDITGGAITIAAWVSFDDASFRSIICSHDGNFMFGMYNFGSGHQVFVNENWSSVYQDPDVSQIGVLRHCVYTNNGGGAGVGVSCLYVDGVLRRTWTSTRIFEFFNENVLGTSMDSPLARGTLDELYVADRALTSAEILMLYNAGNGTTWPLVF